MQDLANNAANVLYATVVRSERSMALLRHETGTALTVAEEAIG